MIGKYLDVCTSHLTKETIDNLVMDNIAQVVSYDYPEGMFVVVPDSFDYKVNSEEWPKDLCRLFEYAQHNEISVIWLDRDAEEIDELPTYDWTTPKEKFLEQTAYVQTNALMETAMRLQDIADFLRYTGDISIGYNEMELLQIFRTMAREFEYKYYDTNRYQDDFIKLTDEVFRKELIEKFGVKEN